jgi:hypothetical protein
MGSRFDGWVYWHYFTITVTYYSSQSILTVEASIHSVFRSTTDSKRPSLSPIHLRHGPRRKNPIIVDVFAVLLPSTGHSRYLMRIVVRVTQQRTVYQESVFAAPCLSSRLLAVGRYVTAV